MPAPSLKDLRRGIGRPVPPKPYTQKEVAALASISQAMVSMMERAEVYPTDRILFRPTQVYYVPLETLRRARTETFRRYGRSEPTDRG